MISPTILLLYQIHLISQILVCPRQELGLLAYGSQSESDVSVLCQWFVLFRHYLNMQNLVSSTKYIITPLVFHTKIKAFQSDIDMIWSTKKQIDSDSDVKCATVQFHGNNHNSQSDCWSKLKFYMASLDMLCYLGFKFKVNQSLGRHYNTCQQRLYEFYYFFLLTCGFPIWLGFFSYKDVTAGFGNFIVLQGYLMGNNIVFICDMDSILMWKKLFYPYYNRNLSLNKFSNQLRTLCKQGN